MNWSGPVPIELDRPYTPDELARIAVIGFWKWFDEQPAPIPAQPKKVSLDERINLTKNKCVCIVCQTVFHSKRKDAKYCQKRCRQKASYRGIGIPTDNAFCAL